ncbi:hypothetical protein SLEP1_g5382 [Rubroshorea leprosula]|uniref:Uncharacterized protein n=1 Tax=Rubroshorea leprosula TaxID=152421 RepID=A0AAV5HS25_9ROSI|nr:hypothetical protein SLEP1_g5382 [Rubroshorea leprosula]
MALEKQGLVINGEAWMKEAETAERAGPVATCVSAGKIFWLEAAGLEKSHGTWESLDAFLSKALVHRTVNEVLLLLDERLLYGVLYKARAFSLKVHRASNSDFEKFKLECKNHEPEGGILLAKAQETGIGMKIWMNCVVDAWAAGGRLGELENAKKVYESGLEHCPSRIPLWFSLANVEDKINGIAKACAVLTLERKNNPHRPELWLEAVRTELMRGNKKEAGLLMERASEKCPYRGALSAAAIEMVPWPKRGSKIKAAYTHMWGECPCQ